MTLPEVWSALEEWPLAAHIGATWWFPLLESLHVLTAAFVVGSILMVDLRLLGLVTRHQRVSRVGREVFLWTWAAFALALLTGAGMFVTRAAHYAANVAFQIKVGLLLLAALNVLVFHFITARGIDRWDAAATPPAPVRLAGGCSLLLWMAVMLAGRWTGHLS